MQVRKILKISIILLIIGSVLATLKVIFIDYTLDEEYQIVMAYRALAGDTLFGTMWEPHQTSAFACILFVRLFRMLTGGTTGVVLFLRGVTTVIQILLTFWIVKVLCRLIRKEYAFFLGICYFNMIPKIIQIPEFSNLQLWFFTVLVLSLMEYHMPEKADAPKKGWLVIAGISMALMVLAYPSGLILFPFFLVVLWRREKKIADPAIFTVTCAACAGVWFAGILSQISWQEFARNISYILKFDLTHDVAPSAAYRLIAIGRGVGALIMPLAATIVMAWMFRKIHTFYVRRKPSAGKEDNREDNMTDNPGNRVLFSVFWVLASELVQLFYWVVLKRGYEEPQIHVLILYFAALYVWRQADKRKNILSVGIVGGILSIAAVVYMSDLDAWYAIPHGMLGALFSAAVLVCALEHQLKDSSTKWILIFLVSLSLCAVFGKGFTLRAGTTDTNTVLGIRGIIRKGPAAGIFTNYMQAYITNCTYEDFEEFVNEGENCLIVTNMVGSAGTSPYLFRDLSVSHFSIVDPTSYDERLLTYWELYPEKKPDVIVVDCWYGELIEPEESWIMQYIENEFDYSSVHDGRYVRFYRK